PRKLGLRHRRRFHGAHKAVDHERRPRCSVSRNPSSPQSLRPSTRTPPRCSDGEALADEMSAKNSLIKVTYENVLNGVVMYQHSADSQNTPLGENSRNENLRTFSRPFDIAQERYSCFNISCLRIPLTEKAGVSKISYH